MGAGSQGATSSFNLHSCLGVVKVFGSDPSASVSVRDVPLQGSGNLTSGFWESERGICWWCFSRTRVRFEDDGDTNSESMSVVSQEAF